MISVVMLEAYKNGAAKIFGFLDSLRMAYRCCFY